jgi:hypothetical protein
VKKNSKTRENLEIILSFLEVVSDAGKPKLSNNKLEKSVSGTRDNSPYDYNFAFWNGKKQSVERKISDLAKFCLKTIAPEERKSVSKQCKRKDCDLKNKRVEIAQKFCAGCGRKYE